MLSLVALLALAPPLNGAVVPDGLGVCAHYNDLTPDQTSEMYRAGLRWVRTDLPWSEVERRKGVLDFSHYDPIARNIHDSGMRPLFILDYGNQLYGEPTPRSPESIAGFVHYAVEAVRHFATYDAMWEIWNEPDHPLFWKPKPDAGEYARLAVATAKAIKEQFPDVPIAALGLAKLDTSYMRAAMDAGLLNYIDEVSVHMYRFVKPETAIADYGKLKDLIASYNPGHRVGVLCTEWGYPLTYQGVTEQRQTGYIARCYLAGLVAGIDGTAIYEWNDTPMAPGQTQGHFGLHAPEGDPRGAYTALSELTRELAGYRYESLDRSDADDYVLHFKRGRSEKLVAWTSLGDPPDMAGFAKDPLGDPHHKASVPISGRKIVLTPVPKVVSKGRGERRSRSH